jgi:Xaa-Pro aminopeptidase
MSMLTLDADPAAALDEARRIGLALFDDIERDLVRPGITESELSREIHELARSAYGIKLHWHKRVVRTGVNTLLPYAHEPPDRVIADDDILFVDLGPVLSAWEADLGRTYVLGDDARKHQLRIDLPRVFAAIEHLFRAEPDITGAALFDFAVAMSRDLGWGFGGEIAGHLIGEFPHKKIPAELRHSYIAPGNDMQMRAPDVRGCKRHWIAEVHLVDEARRFGGFYEDLLR